LISPPCQGYFTWSLVINDEASAAEIGGRNDEENNSLAETVPLALEILRLSFFVFENVTGLLRNRVRNHLSDMLLGVMEQGYSFQMKILNASDYGVPQKPTSGVYYLFENRNNSFMA